MAQKCFFLHFFGEYSYCFLRSCLLAANITTKGLFFHSNLLVHATGDLNGWLNNGTGDKAHNATKHRILDSGRFFHIKMTDSLSLHIKNNGLLE